MMNIKEHQLDHIEHLLVQSMNGIHLLFDNQSIARVLQIPTEELDFFSSQNIEKIQDLFAQLLQKNTFDEKQMFLRSLDRDGYEILLRTYFHIVDNSLRATNPPQH